MKKIFTFAAAILASAAMMAEPIFGPFTLTSTNNVKDQVNEVTGGNAVVTTAFATGGSNEITIEDQTFFKFNSSSAIKCSLADAATFAEGDSIEVIVASNASKKTTGIKLNNAIEVKGDIPGGQTAKFSYIVTAEDGIAGQNSFTINRYNSDSKFGTVTVFRESVTPSTDPVTAAVISGETACAVGGSVELTCTAAKATTYQWYVGGAVIDGATAKKYTFAPTAAGEFSFTCAASNEYTATPVVSAAHVVSVTDPASACGELIKATLKGGTSADMSGAIGGTFDTNLGSGKYKLDKGKYIGIKLAAGTFMAGDEVKIVMSIAGQNYPCLFGDKDRTNVLFLATEVSEALEYVITLPSEANGLTALYLSRGDDTDAYKWNPTVSSISVTRSCEASSNAEIASLTINGEAVEAVEGVYSYTVGASVDLAAVEVVYTLAHPLATATPASGFTVNVPAAGAAANSKQIVVTAQDGTTTKTYTVSVTKSAQASTDATLSALTIAGYTLDPAFASDIYVYTITKAYGAANPEVSAINAAPNDANAVALISYANDVFTITVIAEDKTTTLDYTIHILEAAAKKALLEAAFSNGVHGFIANGNIDVPYLAGETEPTFVAAKFWNPDGDPSAAVVDGKLVVTGIDGKQDQYTITYKQLTPMTASYDTITFTEVPSYIYSVYGWDAEKGVKFSKDVEEATNHRISEGKDRIYIALPVASAVTLISGGANSRPVTITVNGEVSEITKTAKSNEGITIPLVAKTGANLVGIESNGNSGDAGFIKIQLIEGIPTAIENAEVEMKAMKIVRDGQLFILKNGVLYNMQGAIVK